MLYVVKKINCRNSKELDICKARGKFVPVDGADREYLEEAGKVGEILLNQFSSQALYTDEITADDCHRYLKFERVKPPKWNGRVGKIRTGKCLDEKGCVRYLLEEKLQEQGRFWIFKSGYLYYELEDTETGRRFRVNEITFGADQHYYYLYDDCGELKAVIHKPWRNVGEDEYHLYAKEDEWKEPLLFLTAYIDYYQYPYNSAMIRDYENLGMYEDDAAYTISDDELLKLYDENFIRSVILHDRQNN